MSIYKYEMERWQEHQSNVTSFLSLLNKHKNSIKNTDLYVHKLLELNDLFSQIENVIAEIKYECIYDSKQYHNDEKIKNEIEEHLKFKEIVKNLSTRILLSKT